MKISKKKKTIIIILSILLCITAGIFIFTSIDDTNKNSAKIESETIDKSGQIVVQQFGRPIILKYFTNNLRGPLKTSVGIILDKKESSGIGYMSYGNFVMPDIKLIYQKDGLECYEWSDKYNCIITYQYRGSDVKGYPNIMEKTDEKLLYPVAKQEFMTGDFRKIKRFGELLVKQDDSDAKEMLKRYANNSFTQDEIKQNSENNDIDANVITAMGKELSSKYKF